MSGSYAPGITILLHNHVRESRKIGEPIYLKSENSNLKIHVGISYSGINLCGWKL